MTAVTNEIANTNTGELVEFVPVETLANKLAFLNGGTPAGVVSSFQGDDFETKLTVLSAVDNSKPISENLNKKIMVRNIIIQSVEMLDEQTKQMKAQPRIVFVEEDGTAYHAISGVLLRDVENWFGILGHPSSWPAPLPIKVVQAGTGTRKFFTANLTK